MINIIGYGIFSLLCLCMIMLFVMRRHAQRLVITEYQFKDQKVKTDCKICFISDFHYNHFLSDKHYQNMIRKINDSKPDIVIFGGDYVHRNIKPNQADASQFMSFLSQVKAPVRLAVLGNHDKDNFTDQFWKSECMKHDIQLLVNETYDVDQFGIRIVGVDDFKRGKATVVSEMSSMYQILMTHNPDLMEEINSHHFDLVLSGHLHGGQGTIGWNLYPALRVFKLSAYGTKYRYGNVGNGVYHHVSTSGIGAHFGLRFFVYPEVVCITIKK